MIELKKSLGGMSDQIPAQLLPGTKNPNLIIFSKKNSLYLWNPKTKVILAVLEEVNEISKKITNLKLSRTKNSKKITIIASLSCGKILSWKIDLSKNLIRFSWYKGHCSWISCVKIFQNGSKVLTGCLEGNIILWDLTNNRGILRNKTAHSGEIKSLDILKNGTNRLTGIVSYGIDNLLKLWDFKTGLCLKIIEMGIEHFLEIKIKKKKNLLFALNKRCQIYIFNITDPFGLAYVGKFQMKKTSCTPNLLYHDDLSMIILNDGIGTINILLWKKINSLLSNSPKKNIPIKITNKVNFDIISYRFKNKTSGLTLWKGKSGGECILLLHDLETHFLDFFRLSFEKKKKEFKIGIKRLFKRKIDSHPSEIRTLLWFSKDKFLITICNSVKMLYIWNISLQKCEKNLKVTSSYISANYFDNNSLIMGSSTGNIDIYEIISGKLLFSEVGAHIGPVWTLEGVENSCYIGSGSSDGVLNIWEMEPRQIILIKKLTTKEQILNIKILPGRDLILLCGISSTIWSFSLNSLEFKFSLQGHSLPIISLSTCDNMKVIATSSADLSLRVWDIVEKSQKKILFPEETIVTSITFQRCSINFLSASKDGNIKFWSGKNYLELFRLNRCHDGPIWTMKFSENGNFFASGSSDKNVMIWKINDQKLLNKYLKKNEPDFLSNHLILQKNDKKTNNRLKKMVRKFKSILRIICQTKNKQGKCGLKTYLIKLFFMFDKKTLSLCFRSMKKIAFIEFFKLLTQKNENFENEYFLSNFREALKLYSHLIKKYKNIREDVKNLSIKKEISNILKKEKSKAIFTINKIKKIRTRLSFNL